MSRKIVWSGDVDNELVGKVYRGGWSKLILCSDGGDLYAARAVVDYLQANPKTVLVTGKCFSAATAIAAAGETCEATPGTRFLIHEPHVSDLAGRAKDLGNEKAELETWLKWYLTFLKDRTGTPRATWTRLASKETYLDARRALDLGLIDKIV